MSVNDHDERLRQPHKKPELTDADKALLEAEPDWARMGKGAKRLTATPPAAKAPEKPPLRKQPIVRKSGGHGG